MARLRLFSSKPTVEVLDAAIRVAAKENVPDTWLNYAVKAYMSDRGTFSPFLELSHLEVFCATPQYMLAMKCLAMRIGEGYQGEEDVRYLLRTGSDGEGHALNEPARERCNLRGA